MKIWKLDFDVNKYHMLTFVDRTNLLEKIEYFNGENRISNWEPIRIKKVEKRGAKGANAFGGDIYMPIVDNKVLDSISDLIYCSTEILPIIFEDDDYDKDGFSIINVTEALDCIDYEKSEWIKYDHNDEILRFTKLRFKKDMLKGKHIFRAIGNPYSQNFVSDEFKERIEQNDLKGFEFELVWDSDDAESVDKFNETNRLKRIATMEKYINLKKDCIVNFSDDEFIVAVTTWMWGKVNQISDCIYQSISILPTPCQHIFSMYRLKWEVENGGFNQFFNNFDKRLGLLAQEGFNTIGLTDLAKITADANRIYREIYEKYEKHKEGTIESFMESYKGNPLNILDSYFCSMRSLDKLDEVCIEYIKRNANSFGD